MRAHFLLPLAGLVLGVPCLASAGGGALHVRASLDGQTAVAPPSPRRIRHSLDDQPAIATPATAAPLAVGNAAFPLSPPVHLSAAPRRLFRLTLDNEAPPPDSRLIRLSLEEGVAVYGRLSRNDAHGRYFRTSLD